MSERPPRTPSAPRRQIGELRVTSGPNQGRMFALGEDTTLGREETAEIVLEDPSGELSRRHARIGLLDGVATIEDLGSTNGTLLNGERISGPQPLRTGDEITIGKYVLQFESALAEPAQPSADPQRTRVRATPPSTDPQLTRVRAAPPPSERPPTFAPAGSEGELRILSGPGAGTRPR